MGYRLRGIQHYMSKLNDETANTCYCNARRQFLSRLTAEDYSKGVLLLLIMRGAGAMYRAICVDAYSARQQALLT